MDLQIAATKDLHVSSDGDVNMSINGVAEKRTALFLDSHHAHRNAANLQGLAQCIHVGKELVLDVSTQDDHKRRALHFIVRYEATILDGLIFNVDHVRRGAKDQGSRKFDTILPQVCAIAGGCSYFTAGVAMIAHPLIVVPVEAFVAPVSPLILLVIHVSGEGHARNHEVITAKYF